MKESGEKHSPRVRAEPPFVCSFLYFRHLFCFLSVKYELLTSDYPFGVSLKKSVEKQRSKTAQQGRLRTKRITAALSLSPAASRHPSRAVPMRSLTDCSARLNVA